MANMTEEEAARLDEYYTTHTADFRSGKPGVFAQKKAMAVVLDEFTARYLTAKMLATKQTPAEQIADMVKEKLLAAQ
jgi:hypothetical protein